MTPIQKASITRSLARSSWVTSGWNWLLTLVSRAAEAILTITILYATLQIFTQTNPQLDLVMFLAQQIALDAGGIGLIKMANQAKKDGEAERARKARTVAIILMVLMGVGVILSEVESKLTLTRTLLVNHHLVTVTQDFRHAFPGLVTIMELLLLIARGTMAIVYGFTIHDLESAGAEPASAQPDGAAIEDMIRQALDAFAHEQERRFSTQAQTHQQTLEHLVKEQQRLVTIVEEVTHTQQTLQKAVPSLPQEEGIHTICQCLSLPCAEQPEALPPWLDAPASPSLLEPSSPPVLLSQHTFAPSAHPSRSGISKRPRRIDPAEVDAVVHPLLDQDHRLTHRKIAAMPGIPYTETVLYASVKRWRNAQPVVEHTSPNTTPDAHTSAP
jgi:hypothetical protein